MPRKKTNARTTKNPASSAVQPWRLVDLVPIASALAALALLVFAVWQGIVYYTSGHFAYALDDAYIHMALAKNLSLHGIFGATRFEFTSASSSPLWTLLLALVYRLAGVHVLTSLVMTVAFSAAMLVCADFVLRRLGVNALWRTVAVVWVAVAAPLAALAFEGMEHPLQILIDLAFVWVAARLVARKESGWDRLAAIAIALAAAATSVRYEGALIVAIVAVLLALRKRWPLAIAVAAAGVLPIVAYGVVSVANGGYFLPNSVLVKNAESLVRALLHGPAAYAAAFALQARGQSALYLLLAANVVMLFAQRRTGLPLLGSRFQFPLIAVLVGVVHVALGQTGWFFRYEAYLIVLLGLSAVVQAVAIAPRITLSAKPDLALGALAAVLVLAAFVTGVSRGWNAVETTPRAVENVYEQMYQTASFLKANPQYTSVAVGDLGAVAFYNDDLRVLDLEGLAETGEPLGSIGRHNATAQDIARRAKQDGCQIAIVFPDYFDLPSEWTEVARWTISNNIVAYSPTVAFLAIPPTDPAELAADVRSYTLERLPKTVGAKGLPVVPAE